MNLKTHSSISADPRHVVFCSGKAPEVFYSVAHRQEIWKDDPFDVEEIHEDARSIFSRILDRATSEPTPDFGNIFLLLGEAGAGKTHLMRAFRNTTHSQRLGYFGYMQMSSKTDNYGRYILRNLIESLDQPYFESQSSESGLIRLSNSLIESAIMRQKHIPEVYDSMHTKLDAIRNQELDRDALNEIVYSLSANILEDEVFQKIDFNVLVAMLYLQTGSAELKNYTLSFLRGEDLNEWQKKRLGGIIPKTKDDEPILLVEQFGHMIHLADSGALVLCLDQLEDMFNLEGSKTLFRRAMSAIRQISDNVPTSVIVISCLEDYYEQLKNELSKSMIDRIENDPEYYRLTSSRNLSEIQKIIEFRLHHLFDTQEVDFIFQEPLFPFPSERLNLLDNMRTRDVIDKCREFQSYMIRYQETPLNWPEKESSNSSPPTHSDITDLEQNWNDFLRNSSEAPPNDSQELTQILAHTLSDCVQEVRDEYQIRISVTENRINVEDWFELLQVGICNSKAQGGKLKQEIETVVNHADNQRIVLVRSIEFPKNPRTKIAEYLAQLIIKGARRSVVEDSEWRTMIAFRLFKKENQGNPKFAAWRKAERPLARLNCIQTILDLNNLPERLAVSPVKEKTQEDSFIPKTLPSVEKIIPETTNIAQSEIIVGKTLSRIQKLVTLNLNELTRHAAFLGGSGSGKTTVAMTIVENLLLNQIPVILIDRKGDLCRYADPHAWESATIDSDTNNRRQQLKNQTDTVIYTPGDIRGQSLSISIVPSNMHELSATEREQIARYSATALCRMMDYDLRTNLQKSQLAILYQAILILSEISQSHPITIDDIIALIEDKDTALINVIGILGKHADKLVEGLTTLQINKGRLLKPKGEKLNIDSLFTNSSKSRLTVISTKFLGDNQDIEFWIAQFLVELGRWISRNPKDSLQAVIMFDEADFYLPATRKPATKEPMENLLKRARSAGLGIFLATQSPGDFDYKCRDNIRTWFLGRIKEDTSLKKIKPMLLESNIQITDWLSGQEPGQFYMVRDGKAESLQANRSLIAPEQISEDRILELSKEAKNSNSRI